MKITIKRIENTRVTMLSCGPVECGDS